MIFVTGATGQLAGLVIANLIKRYPAEKIVAGVRNIEKAAELVKLGVKVRLADYEKPELWSEAFRGVERVLIVSSSDLAKRYLQSIGRIRAIIP
jgi:NAD(P)H dehydrogenase (quinone)